MLINIGCGDLEKAKRNREMVAKKLYVSGYIKVEEFLKGYSTKKKLPDWIPRGNLPTIDKDTINQWRKQRREERGLEWGE